MAEETNKQIEEEKVTTKTAATEEVREKLEDAAITLIEKAADDKKPWYKKALLYVVAAILGGVAFIFGNFGEEIMTLVRGWLNALAQ